MTKLSQSVPTILAFDCKREMNQLARAIHAGPVLQPLTLLLGNEVNYFPHRSPYLSVMKLPNGNVVIQIVHPSELTIHNEEESFCIPGFTGWREPRVCRGAILRSWNREFTGPIVISDLGLVLLEALNDLVMTYARVANDEAQKLRVTPRDFSLLKSLGRSAFLRSKQVVQVSEDSGDLLLPMDLAVAGTFEGLVTPDPFLESLTTGPSLRSTTSHRGLPTGLLACFRDIHGRLSRYFAWNGTEFEPVEPGVVEASLLSPISEDFAVHFWGSGVRKFKSLESKGN